MLKRKFKISREEVKFRKAEREKRKTRAFSILSDFLNKQNK